MLDINKPKITITVDRFNEILANRQLDSLPFAFDRWNTINFKPHPLGITEAENAEIDALWRTMSGNSCYYGAFLEARLIAIENSVNA